MAATGERRAPHPFLAVVFFAAVVVGFSFGAAYDFRHHPGGWRWFAVAVVIGVAAGTVVAVRGRPAEDTSVRGAWRRTSPWVPYSTGAALMLNVAGPVAGGIATGFAIGMALPMLVRSIWSFAKERQG